MNLSKWKTKSKSWGILKISAILVSTKTNISAALFSVLIDTLGAAKSFQNTQENSRDRNALIN